MSNYLKEVTPEGWEDAWGFDLLVTDILNKNVIMVMISSEGRVNGCLEESRYQVGFCP